MKWTVTRVWLLGEEMRRGAPPRTARFQRAVRLQVWCADIATMLANPGKWPGGVSARVVESLSADWLGHAREVHA